MIFLSYADEQANVAQKIAFGLKNAGHEVFFDRSHIQPGDDYNAKIRTAVGDSELFVFCISPDSVAEGSYALTELGFALDHFGKAVGRVLGVVVVPTDFKHVPGFAASVSILRPRGDVVAETLNHVERLLGRWTKWRAWALMGLATVLCLAALYQWLAPRLELVWVVTAAAALIVLSAPLLRWYWRRELAASRLAWAAPLAVCAIGAAAGWLASEFRPMTVWLLPGSTLMPLIPAANGEARLAAHIAAGDEQASIDRLGESGVLIGTNSTIIELARRQADAAAEAAMRAYLEGRVPERFHQSYLNLWRGSPPAEVQASMFKGDVVTEVRITQDGETSTAVLDSRGSVPLQLVFVELNR